MPWLKPFNVEFMCKNQGRLGIAEQSTPFQARVGCIGQTEWTEQMNYEGLSMSTSMPHRSWSLPTWDWFMLWQEFVNKRPIIGD